MPDLLVRRAIEQSKTREPLVRAMALLSGARVLAVTDKQAAREAFAEGAAIAESLSLDDARLRGLVLFETVRLGTMADPVSAAILFRRLTPDEIIGRSISTGSMLVQALAQSGEFEAALGLLEDLHCETGGADAVVHVSSDPAVQRRAMMAARERWRALRKRSDHRRDPFRQQEFYQLFSHHWRKLEPGEAQVWLEEILVAIKTEADHPTRGKFGDRVELHSMRDLYLFDVLNVVRAMKPPEEIEELLRGQPAVAEAAKVYPPGLESLMAQPPPAPEGGQVSIRGGGIGSAGSGRDTRSIAGTSAARRGDPSAVQSMLTEAHQLYLADTNRDHPNVAPSVFWPSCHAYKLAMYWAGNQRQSDAEPLFAEVPDTDFAILASIEFAAGALGLPQTSGVRMEHYPRSFN
jgi:hypothetical protein